MSDSWVRQSLELLEAGPCVLVTLRRHKGSAPRESGARMVVNENEFRGSIGGGNLEYQAIATAREIIQKNRGEAPLLQGHKRPVGAAPSPRLSEPPTFVGAAPSPRPSAAPRLEPYGLGPALNQCCGGAVELLYEYLAPPAPDWLTALAESAEQGDPAVLATAVDGESPRHHVAFPVGRESALPEALRAPVRKILDDGHHTSIEVVEADGGTWWLERIAASKRRLLLFGAGHVGKAVVKTLADLPFDIRWLDARHDAFPEHVPTNTTAVQSDDPLAEVSAAPPGTTFIVMTHSHDLDEDICHAVLERGDFEFLGLIGSLSKRRRFVHRLAKRGISEQALERLVCPIGSPDIRGKEPATIALSLAAQLMTEPREG